MIAPFKYLVCAAALGLAAVGPACAWGPEGHEIVAEIALYHLTPATRVAVDDVLGEFKLGDYDVASWPDSIRGEKEFDRRYPANGRWHFIDFDTRQRYDEKFKLKVSDDGNDVVSQILRWRDELRGGKLKGERRLDALRFLVHFTGDVHQPLHCAFRYGDMGGNMLPIHSFAGRNYCFGDGAALDYAPSLHGVWDEHLVNELVANRKTKDVVRELQGEITREQVGDWMHGDVLRWANDSYWIARKKAYRWSNGENLPYKWTGPGMDLTSANYIDAQMPIVRVQLQKAGVRLAGLLNSAFDPDWQAPRREAAAKTEKP